MIVGALPGSRNNKQGRARTASASDEEESVTSMSQGHSQGRDRAIDPPRTKLIITSYSRSPDGSTAESGTFGHSLDSVARKRTTRIVESSLDSVDNVTFLEDEKAPEDNDDMTIDSTMKAIEESVQFSKSKVSKKYQDKPLPGFIKLRKDVETTTIDSRVENYEASLTTPAVVHSSHTMSGKMALRRGQTGSRYHEGLTMTEKIRATSPVSGPMERLRIRGFKEPPRDYVEHHKLSPNDSKHELRRYGYGNSPSAKSYALAEVIEKRYSDKNIKKLQVVESPLNKLNVDKTVRVPLYPGVPKSQHAETLEREAAERAISREEKRKHKKQLKRGGSSHGVLTPIVRVGLTDSVDDSEDLAVQAGGDIRMTADGGEIEKAQGDEEDDSVLSDHENFDLDAHLTNAFEAMEEEAMTSEMGNNNNTGGNGIGVNTLDKFDLHSSTGYMDSGAEIAHMSRERSESPIDGHGAGKGASVTTATTASTSSTRARRILGDHVHGQIMAVRVARDRDVAGIEAGVEEDHHVAGMGSLTTGFALSQGSGLRLQEQSSTLKVKPSPTQRRRMKMAQEKKALKELGAQRNIVIAPHGKNLDYFRLKNPQKTSASGRDPRPGALPQFPSPYYEPKTYRLPESLEDRLNNINQEDENKQLDHLISQESSSELLMSQLPAQENRDPHSWRRAFLGGKKIKFDDAQDTDEENENGLDSVEDDFEFSLGGSSVGGESQGSLGEEGDEDADNAPASPSERAPSVQGSRPLTSSQSEPGRESQLMSEVAEDSLLTTSQVDESSLAEGGSIALDDTAPASTGEVVETREKANIDTENSQAPTGSEFIPVTASVDQGDYFPGADPQGATASRQEQGQGQTLGTKTKDPFFAQGEVGAGEDGSVDGTGRASPTGSVSRGLSASISLVRASIDDNGSQAIAPPGNSLTAGSVTRAMAGVASGGEGGAQGVASPPMGGQGPSVLEHMGVVGAQGVHGVVTGGTMDQSLEGNTSQAEGSAAMQALFHPSSTTGANSGGTGAGADDHSVGSQSITSSMNAREAARQRAEAEELKKKRQKERAVAKLRAQQLAKLQEEQSKKTMTFIQNHADPETAKRTDYKFPDHGIQKPGVGEARVRHRDYAYDSMYLHHDGSMRSQKDEAASSLLETVHLDLRLKSPAAGSRPITPSEREARQQEHMFRYTYSGSVPPTPDQSHRKIAHQIQLLEDDLRAHAQLQPDPVVRYDATMVEAMPDPNDMSRADYLPASQRFREEAEEARSRRETEALAAAEARLKKQQETEDALLAAAGIKKPKRKKLQKPKKQAAAEPIPVAYSVGAAGPPSGSGVGASIVPSRVPSRIRKPKLHFSKEAKADEALGGETLAREPKFPVGKGPASTSTALPDIFTPVKKAETEIKISGGVTIFTRDNRALDPEGYARMEWMKNQAEIDQTKHNIWGQDFNTDTAASRAELERNLEMAMVIEKRSPTGSRDGSSRGSRRGTVLGMSPPGSAEGSVVQMPSPGKDLTQESSLSLHSGGGLGAFVESPGRLEEEDEMEG